MFNSHHQDVKNKFVDAIINLSQIIICCEEIVDGISQEKIDKLTVAVESFEKNYAGIKVDINKLIVESIEDSKEDNEINVVKTDDGFKL